MLNKQMLARILAEKAKQGKIAPKGATVGTIAQPGMNSVPSVNLPHPPGFNTGNSTSQLAMPSGTSTIPHQPSAPHFGKLKSFWEGGEVKGYDVGGVVDPSDEETDLATNQKGRNADIEQMRDEGRRFGGKQYMDSADAQVQMAKEAKDKYIATHGSRYADGGTVTDQQGPISTPVANSFAQGMGQPAATPIPQNNPQQGALDVQRKQAVDAINAAILAKLKNRQ